MRTARISQHALLLEGVPAQGRGEVMYLPGGWGCTWRGVGLYLQGVGLYLPGGVPAQVLPPPRTELFTHATENITLPQTSFAGGNKGNFVTRLLFWTVEEKMVEDMFWSLVNRVAYELRDKITFDVFENRLIHRYIAMELNTE